MPRINWDQVDREINEIENDEELTAEQKRRAVRDLMREVNDACDKER